jgi:hypothetical protein
MTIRQLGLRYERLLILSAPISLACILVAFIAVASEAATGKKNADCYDSAASIVEKNIKNLEIKWGQREKIGKVEFANEYVNALSTYMIYGIGPRCDYKVGSQDTNKAIAPTDFAEKLKLEAKNIREESAKKPVRSYGIEMPEKANIAFFGTTITINALTLAQVMQLTLGPILLLWLGSLFNTRYRETILIETAISISDLYPHCINLYINARIPELRKRSILGYYVKLAFPYIPTIFRILLLAIFIVPPTILYCASLYFLGFDDYMALNITAGLLVFSFAFINLVSEMNPWHAGKTFPGPKFFYKP